ncbi:C2H2 finger domain-containing protein [Rutstroemia sp. NJR-2017a BBW]|nr:C2H2 finger domain-containing protein [Rutstroemia sp. NJR-2017a BBW]
MEYDPVPYFKMEPLLSQDDEYADVESAWMTNIDPLLRQSQPDHSDFEWGCKQEQQPLQRFITEPQRAFFTTVSAMSQFDRFSQPFPKSLEPVSALPQDIRARFGSPSTSHELSSDCSSARSPGADNDSYHDGYYSSQGQDDYSSPHATAHSHHTFSDAWTQSLAPQTIRPAGYPCVNLSDVQGFADLQEVTFEADEAYTDMDTRTEFAMQTSESRGQKLHSNQTFNYRDEALGTSIRDAASPPHAISIQASNNDTTSVSNEDDIDAEGEEDDNMDAEAEDDTVIPPMGDEEPSDTEYKPRNSYSSRKRPSNKPISPPNNKRNRVTKTKTKSTMKITPSGNLICKTCSLSTFKDNTALQRHIASAHTRAFICVFSFAGCSSTFASKNEWKRHVSSQHLNLNAWVCTLGACGKVPLTSHSHSHPKGIHQPRSPSCDIKGSEFNRKDLFTQHLRRMHAPFEVKRKGKKNPEWEETVKELQISCLRVRRLPPRRLGCAMAGCESRFEGGACWDERMEHVGKHLEKLAAVEEEEERRRGVVRQEGDELFIEWAEGEGIVERVGGRGWRLCGGGVGVARGGKERVHNGGVVGLGLGDDADADADGEDED